MADTTNSTHAGESAPLDRRTAMRGMLAATVAGATLATASAAIADPVFAAIQAHQQAQHRNYAALQVLNHLEETLSPDQRVFRWNEGNVSEASADDPRWIASETEVMESSSALDDAVADLLETMPTTLPGLAALLHHLGGRAFLGKGSCPSIFVNAMESGVEACDDFLFRLSEAVPHLIAGEA